MELVKKVLSWYELSMEESNTILESNRWVVAHKYITVEYMISLRGSEGFLLDLDTAGHFWSKNEKYGRCFILDKRICKRRAQYDISCGSLSQCHFL